MRLATIMTVLLLTVCFSTHAKKQAVIKSLPNKIATALLLNDKVINFNSPFQGYKDQVFIDKAVIDLPIVAAEQSNIFHLFSHGQPGKLLLEGKWRTAAEIAQWLQQKKLLKNR